MATDRQTNEQMDRTIVLLIASHTVHGSRCSVFIEVETITLKEPITIF